MPSQSYDSIVLKGISLRPAPFVSTSYEYNRSGTYIIGGLLIVTLSGTIISKDIASKITELNNLQSSSDCIALTIGCNKGSEFLDGSGRIRSIDISQNDQPFSASYTIVIAIETINNKPVVEPDDEFATAIGVSKNIIPKSLQQYSENITLNGSGDIMSCNDTGMMVSKSYIKVSGTINFKCNTTYICGSPDSDPETAIENFLNSRSTSLLNGTGDQNPLAAFQSWSRYLDTKSLEIDTNGGVVWQFDIYLRENSSFTPMAFVDINTTDKTEQKNGIITRNISGSIKGLSSSTNTSLTNKTDVNERLINAMTVFTQLDNFLANGTWPGGKTLLEQENDNCSTTTSPCPDYKPPVCYQRISSNVNKSVITGEISFDMEFRDINSCQSQEYELEITIDDTFPATVHQEIIIPGRQIKNNQQYARSIIQKIGSSVQSVVITIRATLNGCDNDGSKMIKLKECVYEKLYYIINTRYPSFLWYYSKESENISNYSFSITHERIKCDYIV